MPLAYYYPCLIDKEMQSWSLLITLVAHGSSSIPDTHVALNSVSLHLFMTPTISL